MESLRSKLVIPLILALCVSCVLSYGRSYRSYRTYYSYSSYYYGYYYSGGLSSGAIAGIVIGCMAGMFLLIMFIVCKVCVRRQASTRGQVLRSQQPGITTVSNNAYNTAYPPSYDESSKDGTAAYTNNMYSPDPTLNGYSKEPAPPPYSEATTTNYQPYPSTNAYEYPASSAPPYPVSNTHYPPNGSQPTDTNNQIPAQPMTNLYSSQT